MQWLNGTYAAWFNQRHKRAGHLFQGRFHAFLVEKWQFDRLYDESRTITRVMSISIHPYLSGVPHRIGYVEELIRYIKEKDGVVFWTGERILDWYRTQPAAAI